MPNRAGEGFEKKVKDFDQIGRIRSPPHRAGSGRPMAPSGAAVPRCCGPPSGDFKHLEPTGSLVGSGTRTDVFRRPTHQKRWRSTRPAPALASPSRFGGRRGDLSAEKNKSPFAIRRGAHRGYVWCARRHTESIVNRKISEIRPARIDLWFG